MHADCSTGTKIALPARFSLCRFAVAALLLSSLLGPIAAHGQDPQLKSYQFSAPARAALDKLRSVQALPAEEWRYHLGDIPHGERPELDDSSWTPIKPETEL